MKYTVHTFTWSEKTNRQELTLVTTLEGDEWFGRPERVLSAWFHDTDPVHGTYRCEPEHGRAVILGWRGKRAVA